MSKGIKSDHRYTRPYRAGARPEELDATNQFLQDLRLFLEGGHVHLSFALQKDAGVEVERSGFPGGPFRQVYLADHEASDFVWRDDEVPLTENTRYIYYRVKLHLDGEVRTFGWDSTWDRYRMLDEGSAYGITWNAPGTPSPNAPPIVREIRNRFNVLLQNHAGTRCLVYRPAWDNGVCDRCTDPRTGSARMVSGPFCSECLGTGFLGGYYSPILTDRVPNTTELARMMGPVGHTDLQERNRSMMRYWPRIEPEDVLRDLDGKLWRVTSCYDGDLYGASAMSSVDITQLQMTHPINSLPLPDGFREVSNAPRRAMARATSLDSFYQSVSRGNMSKASPETPVARESGDAWDKDWGLGGGDGSE